MNSLNIITSRVSPPSSTSQSRSSSIGSAGLERHSIDEALQKEHPQRTDGDGSEPFPDASLDAQPAYSEKASLNEHTPLLTETKAPSQSGWCISLPRRIVCSIIGSIRWVFATLASPGVYLIACFYDEQGNFAPMTQLKKLFGVYPDSSRKSKEYSVNHSHNEPVNAYSSGYQGLAPPAPIRPGTSSSVSSESDSDQSVQTASGHGRSKSLQPSDENTPTRRSIRIKLNSDDPAQQRKHRKTQSAVARTKSSEFGEDMAAHLKSPTSPIAALTKYPKAPAPPRPLIPRRQPSYINLDQPRQAQKTLILDLDETLIHSMSKGGRINSGHMVEVRLNTASLGIGGGGAAGMAQHPILYWVNKRPYCDEFLRRICKWYNLVVFTASVQEYADPVIDWLESERKFFSARYYRQHCTYRQGAYIKDLSAVEPDLSKVMILDNSPLSYLFHEGE